MFDLINQFVGIGFKRVRVPGKLSGRRKGYWYVWSKCERFNYMYIYIYDRLIYYWDLTISQNIEIWNPSGMIYVHLVLPQ